MSKQIVFKEIFIQAGIAGVFTVLAFPTARFFRHKPLFNFVIFGYHIHHAVIGMAILILVGFFLTLLSPYISNRILRVTSGIFGSAIGFVADQWDMWFYLKNNHPNGNITGLYWAMGLHVIVFVSILIFRKFHLSRT